MTGRSPPSGLAKFDSAAVMAQALAQFLKGDGFPRLGQSKLLELPVSLADHVPRRLRNGFFAWFGAMEGVEPGKLGNVSTAEIGRWAADLYPKRRYPIVFVGSSSGALVHLAAALGAPWLPQTFLTLSKQAGVGVDEPREALEFGRDPGRRFLAANPDVTLHQMHDPSQDRLMLSRIAYFRWKFRRLPQAYRRFLDECLAPEGTIIISECETAWPTVTVQERHQFQFGALGGPTCDEYFNGGLRVADFLRRQGAGRGRWDPPPTDGESAEAEWGFEPVLRDDIVELADRRGWRVLRLRFARPDELSPVVADFYRSMYRERGLPADRLLVESFVLLEPYWVLGTGTVPLWMKFNMDSSLRRLSEYLSSSDDFEDIHLMLFAHGVESIGLPPIDSWKAAIAPARRRSSFVGVDPGAYPAHFAGFARYASDLEKIATPSPPPSPVSLDGFRRFLREAGPDHVRLA